MIYPVDVEDAPDHRSKLPTDLVTWTTLLGHWTDLVKAGEGLRRAAESNADASRWRDSIPEVIRLQAITFALGDLDRLEVPDRGLARDRAGLGIEAAHEVLERIWTGQPFPESLAEIARDAADAINLAVYAGLRWIRWIGSEHLEMPLVDLATQGAQGTFACAQPGTILQSGSPVAWWAERDRPPELEGAGFEIVSGPPVQIYRRLESDGHRIRDLVASISSVRDGLPLLVPVCLAGESIGRFTVEAPSWLETNRSAFKAAAADLTLEFEIEAKPPSPD
ncbi:MAG: hypothetical protein CBB69_005525 [Phycisphaera sp. TMED9]|nr:MAG: hypothetical protein CBB69_005525 [Phycisphaera sp. TMED9]